MANTAGDSKKGGKATKQPLVKSGPVYTKQSDTTYDMELKRPKTTLADKALLAMLAWNLVVVSAVLGQYIADIVLYYWFIMVAIGINIAMMTLFGSQLLWGQYIKRDMKKTKKQIVLVAAAFGGVLVLVWGIWVMTMTWQDWARIGHFSVPFPLLTSKWKEVLYWIGMVLSMMMFSVVECLWWNVGYDGLANQNVILRAWGALCSGACFFCLADPLFQGQWNAAWMGGMFFYGFAMNIIGYVVYELASLGGAIAVRMAMWTAHILLWSHVIWQWWGFDAMVNTYSWAPGNLWNLSIQGTIPPPI